MKIIKVNDIQLVEKDVIEITNKEDFEMLNKDLFSDSIVFDLKGVWYLIGDEVAYCFNTGEK
ncbi:hypothetical protein KY333_04930 [Candidatus Woesearchaeota archaeon]|nr:hypothetical protein [Candidatus Woesearchaeota archaeon]